MAKQSEQKVIVDKNSNVGSITQVVRLGIPTVLVIAVLAIAVVTVSGYDLRTLLTNPAELGIDTQNSNPEKLTLPPSPIQTSSVAVLPTRTPFEKLLFEGCDLLNVGDSNKAEEKFYQAIYLKSQSAEAWYWMAESAIQQHAPNKQTALEYVDLALTYAPDHYRSSALKIKLLLSTGKNDEAKDEAIRIRKESNNLDSWLQCLDDKELFSLPYIPIAELDKECYLPIYRCEEIGGGFHE